MSTHDYVIDNQSAVAFRADLNSALAAIVTQNSSATAPTTTYADMIWYDTAANQLKKRNEANSAWIVLGTIDEALGTFTPSGSANAANYQAFNASGTWTKPAGITFCHVELISGGDGGPAYTFTSLDNFSGAGGLGGRARAALLPASIVPSTVTITVGAGGAGATVTGFGVGAAGGAGGLSSFGTLLTQDASYAGTPYQYGWGSTGGGVTWPGSGTPTLKSPGLSFFGGSGGVGAFASSGNPTGGAGSAPAGGGGLALNTSSSSSASATGGAGAAGQVRVISW